MKLVAIPLVALVALTCASCAWVNKVDPPISQAPEPGHPCGSVEHQCQIALDDGGVQMLATCCGNDEVCGGGRFNGCPAGYCCPNDSDEYPDDEAYGVRAPHLQRAVVPSGE